jgi:HK97 family phage portal protein
MGVVTRLAGYGATRLAQWWLKRSTDPFDSGQDLSLGAASVTGLQIGQATALAATAVLACVTMLAEDVAKCSPQIFKRLADGSRTPATDHYLYDLLERPNDWQSGFEFIEHLMVGLVLRGNGYSVILRNYRGVPVALIPVNPDWVQLWESPDGSLFYRITPNGLHMRAMLTDQPYLIPAGDVLHIRGFSLNGLLGASRISVAREAIALGLAQESQAARWIGNGARPGGVLTTEQKLSPDAAKRIAADFKASHGGLQNSGKTLVLEQGLKFDKISLSAQDLEFLASRQFQLQEVARIFRVPPHMIGDLQQSTNNNIESQGQDYANYTITGYTVRIAKRFGFTFGLAFAGNVRRVQPERTAAGEPDGPLCGLPDRHHVELPET